jgi:hypothetical protein
MNAIHKIIFGNFFKLGGILLLYIKNIGIQPLLQIYFVFVEKVILLYTTRPNSEPTAAQRNHLNF